MTQTKGEVHGGEKGKGDSIGGGVEQEKGASGLSSGGCAPIEKGEGEYEGGAIKQRKGEVEKPVGESCSDGQPASSGSGKNGHPRYLSIFLFQVC